MENLGFLPDSVVGGETIWIAAANTVQQSYDIVIAGISPASGYTLAYQFASQPTPISVSCVANAASDGWTLEVTGAQTLTWAPGPLSFVAIATKDSKSFAVDSGTIRVTASPMRVSSWVAVLAAIDAAIAKYAANPNGTVNMGDMSVSYRSMNDLINMRGYAKQMLDRDTANRPRRRILSRFSCS